MCLAKAPKVRKPKPVERVEEPELQLQSEDTERQRRKRGRAQLRTGLNAPASGGSGLSIPTAP